MSWSTEIHIEKQPWIHSDSSLFFLGSCFSENIGTQILDAHFKGSVNPYGTVYNPVSAAKQLEAFARTEYTVPDSEVYHRNELYHTWDHHTLLSHPNAGALKHSLNLRRDAANKLLRAKDLVLVWTLGTNKVYFRDGEPVANCHKYPSQEFTTKFLSFDEVYEALKSGYETLYHTNKYAKLVFTVSPVKYVRDGLRQSTLSKSALLLATQKMVENFENVSYFPAYEIQTEELRDYRFYASDMAHPSADAIDYIAQKFTTHFFDPSAQEKIAHWNKIQAMKNHKIRFPETSESQKFISKMNERIAQFYKTYGISE